MSTLLRLNLRLHIDYSGKLRVIANGGVSNIYEVVGFKIKVRKEKNFVFPILKIEIPEK